MHTYVIEVSVVYIMYRIILHSDYLVVLSLVTLVVNDTFYNDFSFYHLLKRTLIVSCPFASILSIISISKSQRSSPLGPEGTIVKSMSEMKLKRKSVFIDTKISSNKATW